MVTLGTNRISGRTDHDERPLTTLVADLRDEAMSLIRQEIALAKTEMLEKAARTARNSVYLTIGGAMAYLGCGLLSVACVVLVYLGLVTAGVSHATAGWLSPLCVGGIVTLIGCGTVQKGLNALKHETLTPERTLESIKADKQWTEEKLQ